MKKLIQKTIIIFLIITTIIFIVSAFHSIQEMESLTSLTLGN